MPRLSQDDVKRMLGAKSGHPINCRQMSSACAHGPGRAVSRAPSPRSAGCVRGSHRRLCPPLRGCDRPAPPIPNRMRKMRCSRGVKPGKRFGHELCKRARLRRGVRIDRVGALIRSPNVASPSSPTGRSSDVGSCTIDSTCSTRAAGMPVRNRDLRRSRLPSMPLVEPPSLPQDLACGLRHVNGDANGAALIGNGACDGLPDPPHGIGRDLHAMAVVEFFNRVHEAHIAFLDQVQEIEGALAAIFLGDRDDQPEMGPHHLLARRGQCSPRPRYLGHSATEVRNRKQADRAAADCDRSSSRSACTPAPANWDRAHGRR